MLNYIKEEPAKFAAHIVSLIVATIAVLRSFGVGITDEQSAAVTELARGLVEIVVVQIAGSFVRAKVSPSRGDAGPGVGAASLVLIVALSLTGCGLFNRVNGYIQQLDEQYGEDFRETVEWLCARSEAKARGISQKDALETWCTSNPQLNPFVEEALRMRERAESRAMRRARSEAE